ncbi:uncharacterized protein At2g29880 [Rosa chinensis]|nr:uncharacterized protein At2g29880 [Rosa chinensis]
MVDAATRGWRDNSGIFSKQTVEERILPVLNSKLGCHKTYNNYQSRLKWFKNRWDSYSALMRFSFGFVFHSTTKRFTASDEVREDYLKAHPNDANLRYGIFHDYEDLEIAIANGVAVGKNSMGLGGAIDARTLGVGEDRDICIEEFDYDVDSDVFVRPNQNDRSFHSTSPLGSPEILEVPKQGRTQTKRNRTEYEENTPQSGIMEQLNKISTTFEGVYSLLAKRERVLEKREREREYTTWDAIKEIPNMEEAIRFKALELLDTQTKKDGFLKMSPEERANWIFHKMREL